MCVLHLQMSNLNNFQYQTVYALVGSMYCKFENQARKDVEEFCTNC